MKTFYNTKAIYNHHRDILNQQLSQQLALFPKTAGLAFSMCILTQIWGRRYSYDLLKLVALSSPSLDGLSHVPIFLFTADLDQLRIENGNFPDSVPRFYFHDGYSEMVSKFLTSPRHAGPYAVGPSTYTTAAIFAAHFATMTWDTGKTKITRSDEWAFVWDALTFLLLKAGYSAELLSLFNRQDVVLFLGYPRDSFCIKRMYEAVSGYLLRCTGNIPPGFKIILHWRKSNANTGVYFTAKDIHKHKIDTRLPFLLDASIWENDPKNIREYLAYACRRMEGLARKTLHWGAK